MLNYLLIKIYARYLQDISKICSYILLPNNSSQILPIFPLNLTFTREKRVCMPWNIWRLGKNDFDERCRLSALGGSL